MNLTRTPFRECWRLPLRWVRSLGVGGRRPICQHFHIFKNAGTTVDWALRNWFRDDFLAHDEPQPERMDHDKIKRLLLERPRVAAFSSHQARPPAVSDPHWQVLAMIFIRHPIDRARSAYAFHRNQVRETPAILIARSSAFSDYVRWDLDDPKPKLADFQVKFCAAGDATDIALARQRLADCAVVGVVERMDESLTAAEYVLDEFFPGIELTQCPQNVSPGRERTMTERLAAIEDELGPCLMEELRQRNRLDMDLHQFASDELDRRIARIPRFSRRLQEFRARCEKLRPAA